MIEPRSSIKELQKERRTQLPKRQPLARANGGKILESRSGLILESAAAPAVLTVRQIVVQALRPFDATALPTVMAHT